LETIAIASINFPQSMPQSCAPTNRADVCACTHEKDGEEIRVRVRQTGWAMRLLLEAILFVLRTGCPLVASAYAARRSELAKSLGLGRKPKVEQAPKRRSRKAAAKSAASAA
jgi:hypothetical protein